MGQCRDRTRLALEAGERVGVARELLGEDLDRDLAVEAVVAGAVDLAHPPGPQRREDLVTAEQSVRDERHGGGDFSTQKEWGQVLT